MRDAANKPRKKLPLSHLCIKHPNKRLIRSLDEIPDFDTPEAEVKFWNNHYVARVVLDQIPSLEDNRDH